MSSAFRRIKVLLEWHDVETWNDNTMPSQHEREITHLSPRLFLRLRIRKVPSFVGVRCRVCLRPHGSCWASPLKARREAYFHKLIPLCPVQCCRFHEELRG